jgi:hypothetical protein
VDRIFKIVGGIVVLGLVVGAILYFTRDTKRKLPPILEVLSTEVAKEFAERLPRNRDVNDLLVLLPRKGNQRDEEVTFRGIVKDEIVKARKYNVHDWEDVKKNLDATFLGKALVGIGLAPGDEPKNLQEAVKLLGWLAKANQNFDGLLVVNIDEFKEGEDGLGAKVQVTGEIYGVAAGKTIETVPRSGEPPVMRSVDSSFNYTYLHHKIESSSLILRFLGWFLVASTMPFVLIQLVRAVVSKRKNELNLALIIGFTLVDVILWWVLIEALSVGMGMAFLMLLVLAGMGYYNYDACDYIERRLT